MYKPEGPLRVVIFRHEARNLYADLGTILSPHLSNVIGNYMAKKHLVVGDY